MSSGQVTKATLDALTSQVLTEMSAFGLFDYSPTGSKSQATAPPRSSGR